MHPPTQGGTLSAEALRQHDAPAGRATRRAQASVSDLSESIDLDDW